MSLIRSSRSFSMPMKGRRRADAEGPLRGLDSLFTPRGVHIDDGGRPYERMGTPTTTP